MKKNAMLKIAAILMVAVLLTTCAISSTFAKYTTSAKDDVEARVAKFGVTLTTNIDNLFLNNYDVDLTAGDQKGDNSVAAAAKAVAPGTANSMALTGTVSGTPEVAVRVSTAAVLTLTGWTDDSSNEYMPLVFTVGNDKYYVGKAVTETGDGVDNKISNAAELKAAVEAAIAAAGTADFAPNTNLANVTVTNITIGWVWAFAEDQVAYPGLDLDDVKDTDLGDKAANDAAATVKLEITQTVTQLDTFEVADPTDTTAAVQG